MRRAKVIQEIKHGGLNMVDIKSLLCLLRLCGSLDYLVVILQFTAGHK